MLSLPLKVQVQARVEGDRVFMDVDPQVVYLPLVMHNTGIQRLMWEASPHNDSEAEAFTHWDEVIPVECAKCHSTPGYIDFLGGDGPPDWVVDVPASVGTTIECEACHDNDALAMTSVTFNSGAVIIGLGKDANCMQCHQGRSSTISVNDHISTTVGTSLDIVPISPALEFQDIHNQFAGDLWNGNLGPGWL